MDEFIEVGTESTVDLRFRVLGTTCRRCTVDGGVVDPEVFDQRVDRRGAMKPPSDKCNKKQDRTQHPEHHNTQLIYYYFILVYQFILPTCGRVEE